MKLKQIPPFRINRKAAPTVRVYLYNGRLYFNSPTVRLLSLQAGDNVVFFQDEDCPKDWYFLKTDIKEPSGESTELKSKGEALFTIHGAVARGVLKSAKLWETTTFYVAPEPIVIGKSSYWKILTDKTVK